MHNELIARKLQVPPQVHAIVVVFSLAWKMCAKGWLCLFQIGCAFVIQALCPNERIWSQMHNRTQYFHLPLGRHLNFLLVILCATSNAIYVEVLCLNMNTRCIRVERIWKMENNSARLYRWQIKLSCFIHETKKWRFSFGLIGLSRAFAHTHTHTSDLNF